MFPVCISASVKNKTDYIFFFFLKTTLDRAAITVSTHLDAACKIVRFRIWLLLQTRCDRLTLKCFSNEELKHESTRLQSLL